MPENSGDFPVPAISRRIHNFRTVNDEPWWHLWMTSYAIPAVYTAIRAGIFQHLSSLANHDRATIESVAKECDISRLTAQVLLNHLVVLELVHRDHQREDRDRGVGQELNGRYFLDEFSKACLGGSNEVWDSSPVKEWVQQLYDNPITPKSLYEYVTGTRDEGFPTLASEESLVILADLPWAFPATVVGDKMKLFEFLISKSKQQESSAVASVSLEDILAQFSTCSAERLSSLIALLVRAHVLRAHVGTSSPCYSVSPDFRIFVDPGSPFYKGATLRLMGEVAPGCPAQSWEALEKDRVHDEHKRMDQAIKNPDANECYLFALHMDAQGIAAEFMLAEGIQSKTLVGESLEKVTLLDLAGGGGSYAIATALMMAHEAQYYILEQSPMTDVAISWVQQLGLAEMVHVVQGDMFNMSQDVQLKSKVCPNVVFASNIIHDWGVEKNVIIVKQVYELLPPNGRFILHEMPLAENGVANNIAAMFSETLRIWTEGTQYRISEMKDMLSQAGFTAFQVHPSIGPYIFLVGVKE